MLHLLIVAHAPLASAMRGVAAHLNAEAAGEIAVCDVRPDESRDDVRKAIETQLAGIGASDTLILTDVFSATPCNVAAEFANRPGVRVLSGLNVTMLWRALSHLNDSLDRAVELLVAGGKQAVMQVTFTGPAEPGQETTGQP